MQAVILAAGKGTRLKTETDELPKAMIEIGGKPLLEYSLEALIQNGITDVIMVVGFRHETITQRFGTRHGSLRIEYVVNDNHAGSGSMYSLSLVKDLIKDEILLLESDLLYESRALDILLNGGRPNSILVTDRPFLAVLRNVLAQLRNLPLSVGANVDLIAGAA